MEKFTQKEMDALRNLQAKKKRIERYQKQFYADVDAHKDEILDRWGMDTLLDLNQIAATYYGVSGWELRKWITSDRQVEYFKRVHYGDATGHSPLPPRESPVF